MNCDKSNPYGTKSLSLSDQPVIKYIKTHRKLAFGRPTGSYVTQVYLRRTGLQVLAKFSAALPTSNAKIPIFLRIHSFRVIPSHIYFLLLMSNHVK